MGIQMPQKFPGTWFLVFNSRWNYMPAFHREAPNFLFSCHTEYSSERLCFSEHILKGSVQRIKLPSSDFMMTQKRTGNIYRVMKKFRTQKRKVQEISMSKGHCVCRGAQAESHISREINQLPLTQDAATNRCQNSSRSIFLYANKKASWMSQTTVLGFSFIRVWNKILYTELMKYGMLHRKRIIWLDYTNRKYTKLNTKKLKQLVSWGSVPNNILFSHWRKASREENL